MINFQHALEMALSHARPLGKKRVRLAKAAGYILADPIFVPHDLPPFDQSSMDGYAVRAADIRSARAGKPADLDLIETVYAGDRPQHTVKKGTAIKIMTGGCIPHGADAVVKKEYSAEIDGRVLLKKAAKPGEHIRRAGGEFCRGTQVLDAGMRITPPVVGLLAACGYAMVSVYRKPIVALVITGDELIEPGLKLRPGRIYDANSYSLLAALLEFGIEDWRLFHAGDNERDLRRTLARALKSAHILIPVGGVSVGERDLVKKIIEELGVKTIFWRAAIKPGKPNYFGTYKVPVRKKSSTHTKNSAPPKLVFGLPGNPVSALVSYHQIVKPVLLKIMGSENTDQPKIRARLQTNCSKRDRRLEWVRGHLTVKGDNASVRPTTGQDSHMLGGLARANCLIHFPRGKSELKKGEQVTVELLGWR